MGHPRPLFSLFSSLQTNITNLTTNKCEKCPFCMRCQDSNSKPSEHKSPHIITRPGLPPPSKNVSFLSKARTNKPFGSILKGSCFRSKSKIEKHKQKLNKAGHHKLAAFFRRNLLTYCLPFKKTTLYLSSKTSPRKLILQQRKLATTHNFDNIKFLRRKFDWIILATYLIVHIVNI